MGQQAYGKERSLICLLCPDVRHEASGSMGEGDLRQLSGSCFVQVPQSWSNSLGALELLYSPFPLCQENIPLDHSMSGGTFSSFFQIS